MQSGILQAGIRSTINGRRRMIRTVALLLLFCVVLFFLLSEAFVFSHVQHTHNHNGIDGNCAICALLHNAEQLLKHYGGIAAHASLGHAGLFMATTAVYFAICLLRFSTPVQKKTRLNN